MAFTDLLSVKRGHFTLESGLHGDVWFDLEPVFVRPGLLEPYIDDLGALVSEYDLSGVCGPLTGGAFIAYRIASKFGMDFFHTERRVLPSGVEYGLPASLRRLAAGRRIAVVDDAINAGSAVTKSCDELRKHGADPVLFASILTVGGPAPKRLPGGYPETISLEHMESNLWDPESCPLCRSGVPLIDPTR